MKNPSQRMRKRITQREFYSNLLAIPESFNPLHHAGKLLQQFVVDAYVKIEQNRLNYTKTQKQLWIDSYRGLADHLSSDATDGPPGQRIILPSSFQGGPRAMHQSYQDAMAIVAKYGKPDYFLTFTCNPQWREITENLYSGQNSSDRPDLVARVFHRKLEILQEYLLKKHVLGRVVAHVAVMEWQKRGLLHRHMLLIMSADAKPRDVEQVDSAIKAFLPDPNENNRPFDIRFPKDFRETTDINVDGYPKYRRPNNGRTVVIGGETFTNQHVVPYNRLLLLLLNAHVNVEVCGYIQVVKYLYKYVYKGPDRASLRLLQENVSGRLNEILAYLDARYVCAPEAIHHIFKYECQFKSDTVYRLQVHLPDYQFVAFLAGQEQEALSAAAHRDTRLTAWFKLNLEYEQREQDGVDLQGGIDPRTLYYYQIPEFFTFVQETRKWTIRERGTPQIGRMYTATPRDMERFSLRLLLLHRKNIHSFEDLRTIEGVVHTTFTEAARAFNLLHDDAHYGECLAEAAQFQMPFELRALFGYMLAFCDISDPQLLYDRIKTSMAEDFINREYSPLDAESLVYYDLSDRLAILQYNLSERITPPTPHRPELEAIQDDWEYHSNKGTELYNCLNSQQRTAADSILASFKTGRQKTHYIDGPGGSG
ncbi:hypothetical protein ANCCAN_09614 [Ancylostoma caninum]|uniref:Helitron helicase-like domain-containing protein n=1 Tax=Ancylostoma caninum TaxID=29170 RepID=A0A368GMW4_ANCCA|nr:hypothetical protein ANCCAN_09614 [Ancylostoma caninum]